ncbi:MAG: phosphoribosylformylglycinamidine synthase I [Gammaproteobacteria bacterium]|nr:phosphoribosylformylglycinamidine synthase I [Gammaproteobacteria bacterium]MCW5584084.1 phosphoribosylformylglycinamidine synthase I [Gammaproteobacteria bacterium]
MRIAIVQFPGSNCERETMLAVKRVGMEPVEFLWNESHDKLQEMDGYIIVGGFSYEDRSRAGIIAALDPVMREIAAQSAKGKPVLGICNGAQILVETGLVPGLENNKTAMVLTENKRVANDKILGTGYYNAWVNIRLSDQYQRNAFTRRLAPSDIVQVPVAHGEGRFVMTEALLKEIEEQGLNVFQYCASDGAIVDSFPINPNGSVRNIAAVSNKAGNVMAMMPHPERTINGDSIFQSMHDYIAEGRVEHTTPLNYYPRRAAIPAYQKNETSYECIIELIITDNHALTVQNTLRQRGIPVVVRRQMHWEIQCDAPVTWQQIKKSGVLYNERKEVEVFPKDFAATPSLRYLVRPREDLLGQQKHQTLKDHFAIQGIQAIYHGVLWHFSAENANIADLIDDIIHTNIIHNPYAHECYQYR